MSTMSEDIASEEPIVIIIEIKYIIIFILLFVRWFNNIVNNIKWNNNI
jgi:hypothetical protein